MKIRIAIAVLMLAPLTPAFGETVTQSTQATAEITTKAEVSTTLTAGVAADGSIESLLEEVKSTAGGLEETVSSLKDKIAASATSSEEGTKLIDEMLAAATKVNASIGRDSDVWKQLNVLLDGWMVKRDELTEKGKTNPALLPVAQTWQAKIDQAQILRQKILDQGAESENLVQLLTDQREVIIAYYDADAADAVLATMTKMSEQLDGMNTEMKSILQQTGIVADGKAVGNE